MNAQTKIEVGRMTSKGQVLLPKAVRDAIGLAPNARYKIVVNDKNEAVIAPLGHGPEDTDLRVRLMREGIAKLRGTGNSGQSTDEIMQELRGYWQP